jgi:hypothetical protein
MTQSKHTPAPWFVYPQDDQPKGYYRIGSQTVEVVASDIWEEDVHLIAAAPELLEALENLENDDGSIPSHAWYMVQKAIAKAKGEV